jgi:hypothetical protein
LGVKRVPSRELCSFDTVAMGSVGDRGRLRLPSSGCKKRSLDDRTKEMDGRVEVGAEAADSWGVRDMSRVHNFNTNDTVDYLI